MPFSAKKPKALKAVHSSPGIYGSEGTAVLSSPAPGGLVAEGSYVSLPSNGSSQAFQSTSASASTSEGESRDSQTTSNSGWGSQTPRDHHNGSQVWGKQPLALLQLSPTDSKRGKGGALNAVQGGAVKNTFLEFKAAPEHDFFPEMEDADLLPPRLYGRRARTPDPLRHASIEENQDYSPKQSKDLQPPLPRDPSPRAEKTATRPASRGRWPTEETSKPESTAPPTQAPRRQPLSTGTSSPSMYAKAPKPEVRHTFLHFDTRDQTADFFPDTGVEEFLPPRLVGRRARTPDPIRHLPEEPDLAEVAHALQVPAAPDLLNTNALLPPEGWETSLAGIFPFGMPRDLEAQRLAFNQMFPSRVSATPFDPGSDVPRVPPKVSAVTRPDPFMDEPSFGAKDDDAAAKAPAAKKEKKKVKKKRVDYLGQLPPDQKRELAKEVYDTMIQKGFTRPDGYLLMDVYVEIFRGMIGEDSQGRVALHRFSALLRGRSDLFQIFNIGVQVANDNDDWCSRRGEKMVRILLPDPDKAGEATPAAS